MANTIEPTGEKTDHHIPAVDTAYWDTFNNKRKEHSLSWNEVFKRFALYGNGIEYIFDAPPEMTDTTQLDLNTIQGLINKWIYNIYDNIAIVKKCPGIQELPRLEANTPVITIGNGPAIYEKPHLRMLCESDFQKNGGIVISTSHSLKRCLECGVIPNYTLVVDGDEKMTGFFDHTIIDNYSNEITCVFAASSNHSTVERWKGPKAFFRSQVPSTILPNVDTLIATLLRDTYELDSGGNSGGACYNLGLFLGSKTAGLIGMNYGWGMDTPKEETNYYHAFMRSVGDGLEYKDVDEMIEKCYTDHHHKFFNTDCYTDFVYEVFLDSFRNLTEFYAQSAGVRTINCTEDGSIQGDNIECMWFRDFLDEFGR